MNASLTRTETKKHGVKRWKMRVASWRKNAELFAGTAELAEADNFISTRMVDARDCMDSLQKLCSYGHFQLTENLMKVREMLASLGEAHGALSTAFSGVASAWYQRAFGGFEWLATDAPLPFEDMIDCLKAWMSAVNW